MRDRGENSRYLPVYIASYHRGYLEDALSCLQKSLARCNLCPRGCAVNRLKDERGFCGVGRRAKVSSFFAHFGEEKELVGRFGSGTIFFSGCNLKCVYCQNYTISCLEEGREVSSQELAEMMLYLQGEGCHNINLVTPTHLIVQILEALLLAVPRGLRVPLVYNCGGYESLEVIKKLEGIIDIYMPDVKYSNDEQAVKFSQAPEYWPTAREILKEMHRQVGPLKKDPEGVACRGLIIRHLVLPNRIAGSFEILDFIAQNLGTTNYINIMRQYYPYFKASQFKELKRRITFQEYEEVVKYALKLGFHEGLLDLRDTDNFLI